MVAPPEIDTDDPSGSQTEYKDDKPVGGSAKGVYVESLKFSVRAQVEACS